MMEDENGGFKPRRRGEKKKKKTIAMELAHRQVTHFSAVYSYT
jgi:ribosomal protein S6E (S10)